MEGLMGGLVGGTGGCVGGPVGGPVGGLVGGTGGCVEVLVGGLVGVELLSLGLHDIQSSLLFRWHVKPSQHPLWLVSLESPQPIQRAPHVSSTGAPFGSQPTSLPQLIQES